MIESGSLYTFRMERMAALVQRPTDSARSSHPNGINLPKTSPNLAAPPAFPEEESQTATKITRAAPQERARLPLLSGRQAKKENGGARSTDPVGAEERQGWAKVEIVYKRRNTVLYRLKSHSVLVEKILWLLALGVDASALEEVLGVREITILTWLCRSGMQGKKLHARFITELKLVHVQLDELWANVKSGSQDM
jgi:hypothetical protein